MINIVLYEPEIPENTGNIMRTAVAFDATLHLIRPFGFIFDEKRLKRSGAGYIDKVKYKIYDDYEDFINQNQGKYYYFNIFNIWQRKYRNSQRNIKRPHRKLYKNTNH